MYMEGNDKQEILEAIGLLADQMQEMRFDITGIKNDVGGLKFDVSNLKTEIARIKATMVTKNYLDDKLADLHSDIVNFVKRRVPCWTESGV
jgi:hypothetical protein